MSSPPTHESAATSPSQPCADDVNKAVVPDRVAAPPLPRPPRALLKRSTVWSKQSRVVSAKSRQRQRQYAVNPIQLDALPLHGRSPTASLSSNPASGGQDGTSTEDPQTHAASNKDTDEGLRSSTNSCCLCLSNGTNHHAVVVNFAWPGRHVLKPVERKGGTSGRPAKRRTHKTEFVAEGTEVQVMQAIQDALYRDIGKWKRWLWCYEVRAAEEINFHFDDISKDGRAAIQIARLDAEKIRHHAQEIMNTEPSQVDYDYGSVCQSSTEHTQDCYIGQDHGLSCIHDRLSEASTRLQGYRWQHWLRECLQTPERADARRFLEHGLLQKSFVYRGDDACSPAVHLPADAKSLADAGEMRGIHVTMGWNFNRMVFHTRVGCTYAAVGLAVVWLGSVLWAGHRGDWSTAFAFGQLLAASLALMLHHM